MTFEDQATKILAVLIAAFLSVITGVLAAASPSLIALGKDIINHYIDLARSKMTVQQLAIVDMIVKEAVQTAEQSAEIGMIVKDAENKKQYALQIIQKRLEDMGIPFDAVDAARQIEAAIARGDQNSNSIAAITSVPLNSIGIPVQNGVITGAVAQTGVETPVVQPVVDEPVHY